VLGAEILPANATDDKVAALLAHMRAMRQRPQFSRAIFVIIIESNWGNFAEDARRGMQRLGVHDVVFMKQDPKRYRNGQWAMRAGTRTTHQSKDQLAEGIGRLLARRALRFHRDFVVSRRNDLEIGPRERLILELRHFKREMKPPQNRYGEWKAFYIGIANDGGHMSTDCIMALGFVLLNVDIFLTSPDYAAYRGSGHTPG
jgi:hypothetical protein